MQWLFTTSEILLVMLSYAANRKFSIEMWPANVWVNQGGSYFQTEGSREYSSWQREWQSCDLPSLYYTTDNETQSHAWHNPSLHTTPVASM